MTYYRFSGYCLAFESKRHHFIPGTTFEAIRYSHEFDNSLRNLISQALAIIEIDLRNAISQNFGKIHGPFGHTKRNNFFKTFYHDLWIKSCRDSAEKAKELFIEHYRINYREFPDLPIWMTAEIISFGDLSRMYKGMLKSDQRMTVKRYKKQPREFVSWLHHLVYIRNICAHHARFWDRHWAIKPELPSSTFWSNPLLPGNERLFSTLLIISSMLEAIPNASVFKKNWKENIEKLLLHLPDVPDPNKLLGLTSEWMMHPVWNTR
ncbi:MAG: Abi family protein [Spirochaetia bacterium]|nr:Abi family protein [Spirochaetia bacterium]